MMFSVSLGISTACFHAMCSHDALKQRIRHWPFVNHWWEFVFVNSIVVSLLVIFEPVARSIIESASGSGVCNCVTINNGVSLYDPMNSSFHSYIHVFFKIIHGFPYLVIRFCCLSFGKI